MSNIGPVLMFFVLVFSAVLAFAGIMPGFFSNDVLKNRELVPVGAVQDIRVVSSLLGDTTTLRLVDGKVVTLKGKVNPWQPGEPVSQPKVKTGDDGDSDTMARKLARTWCIGSTCLEQN